MVERKARSEASGGVRCEGLKGGRSKGRGVPRVFEREDMKLKRLGLYVCVCMCEV
jgi:hypothetical protein